ncbi:MAG: hypothetical protein HZB99_04480 [Candidatus Harrisonbacteria bacterium]|nr:hypothetical protein [Candidatus Harrisonbacteria bacterium]
MKNLIKMVSGVTLLNLALVSTALAVGGGGFQVPGEAGTGQLPPSAISFTTVENIVRQFTNTAGIVFFSLAIVFMLYAGYLYLTAGGEAEQVSKAKNQLIYSIIAIVIGLAAYSATAIIANFLQTSGR